MENGTPSFGFRPPIVNLDFDFEKRASQLYALEEDGFISKAAS